MTTDEEIIKELLLALDKVMGWIRNWDPAFLDDDEWDEDEEFILSAMRKARGS